jgi:hypothetical protein
MSSAGFRSRWLADLALAWCQCQAAGTPIDVQAINASIDSVGPAQTLPKYFACESYTGTAYEAIAPGAPPWIALAERMLGYSDACRTEGIQSSLGSAMRQSPEAVLRLVGKTPLLRPSAICLPFVSAELPVKQQRNELKKSLKAIEQVREADLRFQRAMCINFIRSVEATLITRQ